MAPRVSAAMRRVVFHTTDSIEHVASVLKDCGITIEDLEIYTEE